MPRVPDRIRPGKNVATILAGAFIGLFGLVGGTTGVAALVSQGREGCRATQQVINNFDDYIRAAEHRLKISNDPVKVKRIGVKKDQEAIKALGTVSCN